MTASTIGTLMTLAPLAHATNLSLTAETSTTDNATSCGDFTLTTESPTATTAGNKISAKVATQATSNFACANASEQSTEGVYEETGGFNSNELAVSTSGIYSIDATWYLSWGARASDDG